MTYTLYILYSASLDKYYIGSTGDILEERIRRHLSDHGGFTSRAKDWDMVYCQIFESKADVMKREREITGWKSKKRIKALITQNK